MASTVTTFGIFKQLLIDAINADTNLGTTAKASMLSRVNELARHVPIELGFAEVESTSGFVSVDEAAKSIEVVSGAGGTNSVIYDPLTFTVPVNVDGLLTNQGAFAGNVGASSNGPVAESDITLQYRLSATDTWKAFDKNTLLEEVTFLQLRANIADQVASLALPILVLVAKQV